MTCLIKPRNIHVQILNGTFLQWNVHTFRDSLIPKNVSFKSRENINNCCSWFDKRLVYNTETFKKKKIFTLFDILLMKRRFIKTKTINIKNCIGIKKIKGGGGFSLLQARSPRPVVKIRFKIVSLWVQKEILIGQQVMNFF